jgi:hypothetical protein
MKYGSVFSFGSVTTSQQKKWLCQDVSTISKLAKQLNITSKQMTKQCVVYSFEALTS